MGKRYLLVGLDSRLADRYRFPFRIHWMGPKLSVAERSDIIPGGKVTE